MKKFVNNNILTIIILLFSFGGIDNFLTSANVRASDIGNQASNLQLSNDYDQVVPSIRLVGIGYSPTVSELNPLVGTIANEFKISGRQTAYPQSISLDTYPGTNLITQDVYPNDDSGNQEFSDITNFTFSSTINGKSSTKVFNASDNYYSFKPSTNFKRDAYYVDEAKFPLQPNNNKANYVGLHNLPININGFHVGDEFSYYYNVKMNENYNNPIINENGYKKIYPSIPGKLMRTTTSIPIIKVNYFDINGKEIKPSDYVTGDNIKNQNGFSINIPTPTGYKYDSYSTSSNYDLDKNGYATNVGDGNGIKNAANMTITNNGVQNLSGKFNTIKTSFNGYDPSNPHSYDDWATNSINMIYKSQKTNPANQPSTPITPNKPNQPANPQPVTPSHGNYSSDSDNTVQTGTNSDSYLTPNDYIATSGANEQTSDNHQAPVAVNNDRKMYNHKTRLIKRNGQIKILIQPKYAANDANGNLAGHNVVSRKLANGKIVHTQLVTLNQYNSMLIASGKKPFTEQTLRIAYAKRHSLRGIMKDRIDKTTFDAKTTQNGDDTLIDTTGVNNGFNQPTDKQMVKDTDDIRVKVHRHHVKKDKRQLRHKNFN